MKKSALISISLLLFFAAGLKAQSPCNAKYGYYIYSSYYLHFYPAHYDSGAVYTWNFGDSTTSSSVYPFHTFTHSGRFKVCLTVTDSVHKCSDTWCDSINVSASSACDASFTMYIDSSGAVHYTPAKNTYTYYYWVFGDSTTSKDMAPHHTYKYAGLHHPCLYVSDTTIGCAASWCDTITTHSAGSTFTCNARYRHYAYSNRYLVFFPLSTNTYTSYSWNFGDSTTSYNQYGRHTFTHNGRFKVCLTVSDSIHHCSDTWCDSITVSTACSAAFTMYKDSTGAVHFTPGTKTYSQYYWSFGDTTTSSTNVDPTHTFKYAGVHRICLYISDTTSGCASSWCDTISTTGGKASCNARFSHYIYSSKLQFHFYPTSSAAYTSYYWTFSDSTTSKDKYPFHTFKHKGHFYVCLTVSDSIHKCSDTWCDSVRVGDTCNATFYMYKDSLGAVHCYTTTKTHVLYYWAFGDSTHSFDLHPAHTFAHAGVHRICLYIYDSTTGCSTSWCDTISTGGVKVTCNARFGHYVYGKHQLHFYPVSTAAYTSYYWTFSDSTTSKDHYPLHTFKHNGHFKVCLTVTDSIHKCSDTWCDSVAVSDSCHATFTSYKDSSGTIHFNPSVNTYTSYYWTFGDSTYSLDVYPKHVFKHIGRHYVCLRISDTTSGCSATWCDSVTSGYVVPCNAYFTIDSIDTIHHIIHVTNRSIGQAGHEWIFGDSTYSTADTATHHYKLGGLHRLCLYIKCTTGAYTYYCLSINGDTAYTTGKHGGTFTLMVRSPTSSGITELKAGHSITAYPNPVYDMLTLVVPNGFDKGQLVVRDLMGRAIYSNTLTQHSDYHVDTQAWHAGIYIVQLISSQGTYSTRIIKQ